MQDDARRVDDRTQEVRRAAAELVRARGDDLVLRRDLFVRRARRRAAVDHRAHRVDDDARGEVVDRRQPAMQPRAFEPDAALAVDRREAGRRDVRSQD